MSWHDHKLRIAIGLWAIVVVLLGPSVYYLLTLAPPKSDVLLCYPEFNPEYFDEENDAQQYALFDQELRANLAAANNPDSQMMSLLTQSNGQLNSSNIDALAQLSEQYADNGFISSGLLAACAQGPENNACEGDRIGDITRRSADNGAVWGELAALEIARANPVAAVSALRQATAAPEYDDYFSLQLNLIDQASSLAEPAAKVITAFRLFSYTHTSIGIHPAQLFTGFCAEESARNSLAADVCLAYGARVMEGSTTLIGQALGSAVQEVTYQAIGDQGGLMRTQMAAEQRKEALRRISNLPVGLMTYDGSLAELWIDSLIEYGEVETVGIVREEALRRSQDPDYRPCDPPRLRFEFPYFYMGEERVNW